MTIRLRLTLWFAGILVLVFAIVSGLTWLQYSRMVRQTLDQELAARADDVRSSLGASATASPDTTDPAWLGIFAAVFDRHGRLRSASRDAPAGLSEPALGQRTVHLGPTSIAYAVDALAGPDGTTIVAGRPLDPVERGLRDLAWLMLSAGLLAASASFVGGWWVAGRALRPVDAMVREANAIGTGDLARRLPIPSAQDEIGRLARTLNALLERVAETVRRERRFVAVASHDLRTPLAALTMELELAASHPSDRATLLQSVRAAQADAIRLTALASDLLRLAEADASGRDLLRQDVPLKGLVETVIDRVRPLAETRDIRIALSATETAVDVDRVRLEQAIGNLLGNAIRESPDGETVEVRASADADGAGRRTLEIDVLDRGPGVPGDLRDRLFQPFGAGPAGRDGRAGLGLATAAAATIAHGGRITYQDRPGGGAWFRIMLPVGMTQTAGRSSTTRPAPA